jgi:hypothetical protein
MVIVIVQTLLPVSFLVCYDYLDAEILLRSSALCNF